MSTNYEQVQAFYQDGREEGRAHCSRAAGMEFYYTKKILLPFMEKGSRVIELGCATGYYGMAFADACGEYLGVDLCPEHIAAFQEKIAKAGLTHVHAQVGDATNLKEITSQSFDLVLCLGPMYHLPPEERELVFRECSRIAKPGGLLAFAYISPFGAYLKAALAWPEQYPNHRTNEFVLKRGTDDMHTGLFYYVTPEEISFRAQRNGLTVIENLGTDFSFQDHMINQMNEEQFDAWMTLADQMAASESCTGLANHSLLICRKGEKGK